MSKPYYFAKPSHWPLVGSIGIFCMMWGGAHWLHASTQGPIFFFLGTAILLTMLYGWFGAVIKENQAGLLDNKQMDRSFRLGMFWFIFTEAMFFFGFFGILLYVRVFSVPWLGGQTAHGVLTHQHLWPLFKSTWPLLKNPNPQLYPGPSGIIDTWHLPAINTAILLTSGATLTVAHFALLKNRFKTMVLSQITTIILGFIFISLQMWEYGIAYTEKGLKLSSGIYGSTFFILTGFHALHVTLGAIMLTVILIRMLKHHFTPQNHFAFEATAWYWHFVDVVWLILFVFVYWI